MLNYRLRLLDTGDKSLQRVFKSEAFKTGPVLSLLDKVWFLRENEAELREILFSLFKVFRGEEWILAVAKYLKSAGVSIRTWDKLEREAIKRGLLKKGGYMDIREEIRMEGRQEGRMEGRQEGRMEGRQEGRMEGRQEGRMEGRQEGLQKGRIAERQEIVLNMLQKKADISFISEVTGLSKDEIRKLKNGS